jgi:hypothetical protein
MKLGKAMVILQMSRSQTVRAKFCATPGKRQGFLDEGEMRKVASAPPCFIRLSYRKGPFQPWHGK